jgi:hypothetical protein
MVIYLFALLSAVMIAQADVVRETTSSSTIASLGSNEGTTTNYFAGDRNTAESAVKWSAGFMKTITRGKPAESSTITRIDKEVVWTLDLKKKTYTEMTFAEFREMLKKGMAEEAPPEEDTEEPAREDAYEWTVSDSSNTEPKTIRWVCRNAHVIATGVNKGDPNDMVIIRVNTWNSEEVPGSQEIAEYYARYLKALGLNDLALTPGLLAAAQTYAKKMEEVLDKAKLAKGEAVQSLVEIKHHQLKGKKISEALGEGAASEIAGKMPFGLGSKPKQEQKPEYVWKTVFQSETEITRASTDTVEPVKFEIPDGFKLKK